MTHHAEASMHDLLLHLVAERGPIRLVVELAIALGSLATTASWSAQWLVERRRRRAAVASAVSAEDRRAAA